MNAKAIFLLSCFFCLYLDTDVLCQVRASSWFSSHDYIQDKILLVGEKLEKRIYFKNPISCLATVRIACRSVFCAAECILFHSGIQQKCSYPLKNQYKEHPDPTDPVHSKLTFTGPIYVGPFGEGYVKFKIAADKALLCEAKASVALKFCVSYIGSEKKPMHGRNTTEEVLKFTLPVSPLFIVTANVGGIPAYNNDSQPAVHFRLTNLRAFFSYKVRLEIKSLVLGKWGIKKVICKEKSVSKIKYSSKIQDGMHAVEIAFLPTSKGFSTWSIIAETTTPGIKLNMVFKGLVQ